MDWDKLQEEEKKRSLEIPRNYLSDLELLPPGYLNDTAKVRFLLDTSDGYVCKTLLIEHIRILIQEGKRDNTLYDYEMISDIMEIYKSLIFQLNLRGAIAVNDYAIIYEHAALFAKLVENSSNENLSNSYIGFLLACGELGIKCRILPSILLKTPHINCYTFFLCINEFLLNEDSYDLFNYQQDLCNTLQEKLDNLLGNPKGKATDEAVGQISIFYMNLFMKIGNGEESPFIEFMIHRNLGQENFGSSFLRFMKKFNHEYMFSDWINILIQKNQVARSIHLVEMVLYYYISSAEKFKVLELLSNEDWAKEWFMKMAHTDFFGYTEMFLNNEPYCFLIFTKLLRHYHCLGCYDMLNLLSQVNYDFFMRKHIQDESIHKEVLEMLHINLTEEEMEEMSGLMMGWERWDV